jgi:hypothetical protein
MKGVENQNNNFDKIRGVERQKKIKTKWKEPRDQKIG